MAAQVQHKDSHGKQWEYYTDMPVGEILRRARVHYGQTLSDVEAVLRIRASQLGSLEEGKLEGLPGRVYAIGFVRAYSEYLGLDGDKMVQLFKLQSVGSKAKPELNFPVPASQSKLPGIFLLGMSLGAVVLIVALFSMFHTRKNSSAVEDIPAVSPQLKAEALAPVPKVLPVPQPAIVVAAPVAPAAPAINQPPAVAGQPPQVRVVINIKDNTWVEIRNSSGKPLISQVLNPGDTYLVPNEQGLILATGNIGGLQFVVDGQTLAPLGNKGDVARGIRLDPDVLKPAGTGAAVPANSALYQPAAQPAATIQAAVPAAGAAPQALPPAAPAWQSAIRPAVAQTVTSDKPATTGHRYLRPEDQAYRPSNDAYRYRAPGPASGSSGMVAPNSDD